MSYCWPSHTFSAVSVKSDRISGKISVEQSSINLYERMHITSPDRMAIFLFHFSCTVGLFRLSTELSIISSCKSVKLWNTSIAKAHLVAWEIWSEKRLQAIKTNAGLILFPPMD